MGQAVRDAGLERKFRELRPHVASHSAALDDLCAVAVAATGARDSAVTICDGDCHVVLGSCNFDLECFPRFLAEDLAEQFVEADNLDRHPGFAAYAAALGQTAPVRSFLLTPIRVDGQAVGIFAIGSDKPEGAFSPLDRALLFRLARVAEGLLWSEISLSRVMRQALAAIADNPR